MSVSRAVLFVAAAGVLSACSGISGQVAAVPQGPGLQSSAFARAASKKSAPIVFVSDAGGGAVYAFSDSGAFPQLWTISGAPLKYPGALYVDGASNLYVADQSGSIFEYDAPGASGPPSGPSLTYANSGNSTSELAVCGDYVYAADVQYDGGAAFTVWTKGTAAPLRVVTQPAYQSGFGAGIVCTGSEVYFAYATSYQGPYAVDRYAAGGTGSPTTLSIPFSNSFTLDASAAQFVTGAIDFYTFPGAKLIRALSSKKATWIADPVAFAYEPKDKALWDADGSTRTLNRFTSKGKLLGQITKPASGSFVNLGGVAVSPPDHD
jgi:hypothetical protein